MSTRTLIEINHDFLHELQDVPELLAIIVSELGTSMHCRPLNEANERGRTLDIGHGLRIVLQYHHTTDVAVTTKFAAVKL
ncbi:hypothetical protein [Trinickia dinghuensis]|uniref:Uncharacterized protein n=1 Tax=Trinickia dinghuensis TaxID=2291023 RepID=A0A3D8K201_9BURK|nr:hypothetical protein [Trinickia dinghuensis]RDU99170.1 hypothetical protein DWV00_08570 [Trinickia dinghuensis]